jgi:N-acyl-D-aspartate/D-glutamate deacylase
MFVEDYDIIIENGLVFDGLGTPGRKLSVGVKHGRVAALSEMPLSAGPATRIVDAKGAWVMPGFIDLHTHYDAEAGRVRPEVGKERGFGTLLRATA